MDDVVHHLNGYLETYFAIFVIVGIERVPIPMPGETVPVAASTQTTSGCRRFRMLSGATSSACETENAGTRWVVPALAETARVRQHVVEPSLPPSRVRAVGVDVTSECEGIGR